MKMFDRYRAWRKQPPAWSKQFRTDLIEDLEDVFDLHDPILKAKKHYSLHDLRTSQGMTAAVLAEKIGIPESSIFYYESGERRVPHKHIDKINEWMTRHGRQNA